VIALTDLLPSWLQLGGLLGVFFAGAVLWLCGCALALGRGTAEMHLFAGWGALSLVLTLWGVATQGSMRWPALLLVLLAAIVLAAPRLRPSRADALAVSRVVVLALPIWFIMLAVEPALPDTFTNFLPNAVYVFDHGFFPADDRAPAFAVWPAFPYNQPLATYLATLFLPQFPPGALVHFNILLQVMLGLLFARQLRSREADFAAAPSWSACAGGLLLVMALNPGFVPRIDFTSYAEPALTVGVAIVGWLAAGILGRLAGEDGEAGARGSRSDLVLLSASLVALVGTKQVGIVLAVGLLLGMAALALADRRIARGPALAAIVAAALPALLLWAVWRWYVLTHFAAGELKLLPPSAWQFDILPITLANILRAIAEKPVFFTMIALVIGLAIGLARRALSAGTRLLLLTIVLFAVYNGFLVLVYVIHMGPVAGEAAHSYFRYMTHVSLLAVLALTVTAREWALASRPAIEAAGGGRWVAAALVVLALLAPVGFAKRLRFDLQMPQPLIRGLALEIAGAVADGERLALLMPGDNGSDSLMLRAALELTPPRRRGLDIYDVSSVAGGLEAAAKRGYVKAVVSCAASAHEAQLLAYDGAGWRIEKSWPYPAVATRERWTTVLAAAPLCRS